MHQWYYKYTININKYLVVRYLLHSLGRSTTHIYSLVASNCSIKQSFCNSKVCAERFYIYATLTFMFCKYFKILNEHSHINNSRFPSMVCKIFKYFKSTAPLTETGISRDSKIEICGIFMMEYSIAAVILMVAEHVWNASWVVLSCWSQALPGQKTPQSRACCKRRRWIVWSQWLYTMDSTGMVPHLDRSKQHRDLTHSVSVQGHWFVLTLSTTSSVTLCLLDLDDDDDEQLMILSDTISSSTYNPYCPGVIRMNSALKLMYRIQSFKPRSNKGPHTFWKQNFKYQINSYFVNIQSLI